MHAHVPFFFLQLHTRPKTSAAAQPQAAQCPSMSGQRETHSMHIQQQLRRVEGQKVNTFFFFFFCRLPGPCRGRPPIPASFSLILPALGGNTTPPGHCIMPLHVRHVRIGSQKLDVPAPGPRSSMHPKSLATYLTHHPARKVQTLRPLALGRGLRPRPSAWNRATYNPRGFAATACKIRSATTSTQTHQSPSGAAYRKLLRRCCFAGNISSMNWDSPNATKCRTSTCSTAVCS